MAIEIATYEPSRHYDAVAALWARVLGKPYPVTDRVLRPRIWTRASLEPGDGAVALSDRTVVGFAMAEITRDGLTPPRNGSIEALLVDPAVQRQGVGRRLLARLEEHLRAAPCAEIHVGCGMYRFWSGTPVDLPAATAFFEAAGYRSAGDAIDMVASLDRFAPNPANHAKAAALGVTIDSLTPSEVSPLYDLLTREAAGWRDSMIKMVAAGDLANVLVVRKGGEIIGCLQTFTPASRFRAANLVWEGIYGPRLGGFGAVLIAQAWRKHGLGVCMIGAAAEHVKRHGASHCFIDWTSLSLALFYGKIGAEVCGTFRKYMKPAGG